MTEKDRREALERWEAHCKRVNAITTTGRAQQETPAEKQKRIRHLRADYDSFCEYYFPHWMQLRDKVTGEILRTVHNAVFHSAAARRVKAQPNLRAVFEWPRGHAKSTHFDVFIPLWLIMQEKPLIHVMVLVGKSEDSARTLLADIQAELESNQRIIDDYGIQRGFGAWTDGEFVTQAGIAFFARGRGQSPRGLRYKENRPDYIVIDDLDDDELCRNEARVATLTDWVKEALFGTFDAGRGRFVMVGNLISRTSVLQNLIDTPGVYVSKVCAVDAQGNPAWPDKWTKEEAAETARFMGYRAWQKEMMHNPLQAGGIFRPEWIRWKKALPPAQYDDLVVYVDPSFRSTTANDYKACRLWGRMGSELHLLRTFVRQATVAEMVRWMYDLHDWLASQHAVARWYIEGNFLQDILLDEFRREGEQRGYQLPISADRRKKPDKIQRIEAVSPLWERGFVFYNEAEKDSPDMQAGIDQTLALEHGSRAHDDAPDADEGAIWMLQRGARTVGARPLMARRARPRNAW